MSLLREIQEAATSSTVSVSTTLLKCQLLAARLDFQPLREWVDKELNGYPHDGSLPDYRRLGFVEVRGQLAGMMGSGIKNFPIPMTIIEEKHRETLFRVDLYGGIAGYEHLVDSNESTFSEKWPAHYIQYYAQEPMTENGMHLVDAAKVISKGAMVAMLSTVRSRILTLASEIERENPEAGEAVPGTDPVPRQSLQKIIAVVHGDASFVTPAGDMTLGDQSVVGSRAEGDIVTGRQQIGGDRRNTSRSTATTHNLSVAGSARHWFSRHPWLGSIAVGVLTSILPAIYLLVWGLHLP